MSRDWLQTLLDGTFQLTLPRLVLHEGQTPRFEGSGQVIWSRESGIRIVGATSGGEDLVRRFGRLGTMPGRIIPAHQLLRPTGQSVDRWTLSAAPVTLEGYSASWDSPHVAWDVPVQSITLTRSTQPIGVEGRSLHGILGPALEFWPQATKIEVENPYFGGRSVKADWLEASTSFGPVAARSRSADLFEVRFSLDPDVAHTTDAVWLAIASAFAFVLGRRVVVHGYEEITRDSTTRSLTTPGKGPAKNRVLPPLTQSSGYVETLLGQAISFFLTEQGEQVRRYLHLGWDTADNDFETRAVIAAICVEGLARLASKDLAIEDDTYTAADTAALLEWAKANEASRTKRFLERVVEFVRSLGHRRPVDVLWAWQKNGMLGVTRDDIKAWKATRNPAAHGQFAVDSADWQRVLDRFHRVLNMMNRIVLHLIGFRGQYLDYASGWREMPFPPSRPANDAKLAPSTSPSPRDLGGGGA